MAIFNVKYSSNLGDGVIAQCLEAQLELSGHDLTAISIDLAGRTRFDRATGSSRSFVLATLQMIPARLRAIVLPMAISAMVRLRLRPRWRAALKQCDLAVIGGGALLADADQNFPIKLANALSLCAELRIPVAIAHVGMKPGWSKGGRRRFLKALRRCELVRLTFRDADSIEHFATEFGTRFGPVGQALDPGLLACETYAIPARPPTAGGARHVGICMTSPMVLRLHGGEEAVPEAFEAWMKALISGLAASGNSVVLFTNGSPEDELFADRIHAELERGANVARSARFIDPPSLARFIATLDCVVAHRLHACIVGFSCAIPIVGMTWDKKLDSFFRTVSLDHCVLDPAATDAAGAQRVIARAMAEGADRRVRAAILAQCREGIAELATALSGANSGHA